MERPASWSRHREFAPDNPWEFVNSSSYHRSSRTYADRTVAALDLLHELSTEHQIVLFSQEDEVLSWAEQHLTASTDRLIRLDART